MSSPLKNINVGNQKNLRRISEPKSPNISEVFLKNSSSIHKLPSPQPLQKSSITKQGNRSKLIEQNIKLKSQVVELAQQMQLLFSKQKQKKKYGIGLNEHDKQAEEKILLSKKQEARISELNNQIFNLAKEIKFVYDEPLIIEKQNEIKTLENQVKRLESEIATVKKMKKQQQKTFQFFQNDDIYSNKIEKNKSQLAKIKQECKSLHQKTQQNQKLLLKAHSKSVAKNIRLKQIEERIKQNKEKLKKGVNNIVTIEMISQIELQIMKLQRDYIELKRSWQEKINNVDTELTNRKLQEQKKLLILKEKERQVRLNDLKMKQFKKLSHQTKVEKKLEDDANHPKDYRSRRNIKFIFRENH